MKLSVKKLIEQLFLENLGKVVTADQIKDFVRNPVTGKVPENWHQRVSELRTDEGYRIDSSRDDKTLKRSEYRLVSCDKKPSVKRRKPTATTWQIVLERCHYQCQFGEDGQLCGLREGDRDPIGGGTVRLTADHKTPHSVQPDVDSHDADAWGVLCGRHQVQKRNYWSEDGTINWRAILQSLPRTGKQLALEFLNDYFARG